MSTLTTIPVLSYKLNKPWLSPQQVSLLPHRTKLQKKNQAIVPVARLFGPAIFEASKLKVLFLGVDDNKHPGNLPRTYTLTHSDITSKLTLAISQTINNSQKNTHICGLITKEEKNTPMGSSKNHKTEEIKLQGWYNKLQRDEVVAQWRKVKGKMYLHVHCHISGGHFLLDLFARLRYYIFCKELPMVLKAFVHGDGNLFNNYPELEEALVWVHFHSNIQEFNKVECWGPLKDASSPSSRESGSHVEGSSSSRQGPFPSSSYEDLEGLAMPQPCQEACDCCFPPMRLSSIPWSQQDPSHPNDQEVPNIMTH